VFKGNDAKGGPAQPVPQTTPAPFEPFHHATSEEGTPSIPFFVGDHALVHIKNGPDSQAGTTWLVDAKKKVLRPFASEQAFNSAFKDPEEARKAIVGISSKELGPGGVLEGFTLLKNDKSIKHDGTMDKVDFSPHQISKKYVKTSDPQAESKALTILDSLMGSLKTAHSLNKK
jgi:hypothetical protein